MKTLASSASIQILISVILFNLPVSAQTADKYPDQVLWGDTHLHTSNSFDVYLFDTPSSTPDSALRFARGLPIVSPTTGVRWQLHEPLDFAVVADHAEMIGSITRLFADAPEIASTKTGKVFKTISPDQSTDQLQSIYEEIAKVGSGLKGDSGLSIGDIITDMHSGNKRSAIWQDYIDTVERHNTPGEFTAMVGWEWSSQPDGANLHRVIFTPAASELTRQFLPYSALESQNPEDLWQWLGDTHKKIGADFIAIPHNANLSIGMMFATETLKGEDFSKTYAETRSRWEPVMEVTQIKGDSEAHPLLSPTDEFADYETYGFVLTPNGGTPPPNEGSYVRSGLKSGLALGQQLGTNPFKYGVIGSTDSHTGMSAVEEDNFAGKGQHDASPEQRPHPTGIGSSRGWDMGAAGYAGVWATENTREAIFAAFKRREVYATTGPRITLRFFGGDSFEASDTKAADLAGIGYRKGVPMGADLSIAKGKTPNFLVAVMKDPNGANLDRIQIIKGWLNADGTTDEKVYDVALSNDRKDGAIKVGNTVDLKTGKYTNTIGAQMLSAVWTDPDFEPSQSSFYYVRALEIPTPRHSLLDAIAIGIDVKETGRPATIQERVYSSPIWYTP
ncbi:MAG: DUF3604 domain-containing protein [Parahaliea sp.]